MCKKNINLLSGRTSAKLFLGTHSYISNVLLVYTLLREHLESQLQALSSYKLVGMYNNAKEVIKQQIMLKINTLNAEAKLLKYRLLLTLPIYFAVLVLVPWNKWRYIESNLTPAKLVEARSKV